MRGGRTLLVKLLKGSRDKKVLEFKLNESPSFGYFSDSPTKEIVARVDWLIQQYYLQIEYDGRLPLLVYTAKGWEIEKETYSDELYNRCRQKIETNEVQIDMLFLKERNREMIDLLLDKIESRRDGRFIPLLHAWQQIAHKKVRQRIRQVIHVLEDTSLGNRQEGTT
jgi:hypothetical protein